MTLELDRIPASTERALRDGFQTVEPEGPVAYYGPCTAIRRGADGRVTLGLDDRWRGFGAILPWLDC